MSVMSLFSEGDNKQTFIRQIRLDFEIACMLRYKSFKILEIICKNVLQITNNFVFFSQIILVSLSVGKNDKLVHGIPYLLYNIIINNFYCLFLNFIMLLSF